MNKILFVIAIMFGVVVSSCDNTTPQDTKEVVVEADSTEEISEDSLAPKIEFETLAYDFGEVVEGTPVNYEFKFKNTGAAPLIIKRVAGSCGCTVPVKPEGAIAPGEENVIAVEFDSSKRGGSILKHVNVETNASDKIITLNITGKVLKTSK